MLFVAIIVIIAFTFFYDPDSGGSDTSGLTVFEAGGEKYSQADFEKMRSLYSIIAPRWYRGYGLFTDLEEKLTSERYGSQGAAGRLQAFVYNLSIFRQKAGGLGLDVSNDEIAKEIQNNPAFRSPTGGYDAAAFDNFVSNELPRFQLAQQDFYDLVRDKIRIDKLSDVLAAAITPSQTEIDTAYSQQNQKIVAYVINDSLEEAKKSIEITDEAIEEAYDKNIADGQSLQTDEKRAIEYAFFEDPTYIDPNSPKLPEPTPGAAPETPEKLDTDEKRALDKTFGTTLQSFLDAVRAEGADFTKLAKEHVNATGEMAIEVEYQKFDVFPQNEAPQAIKENHAVLDATFSQQKDTTIFHTREPKGIWVIHITDIEAPRDLTLEEASAQIRKALAGVTALDAVTANSEATKEKLAEATKDGPTFKAAAEKLGYEVTRLAYQRTPPANSGITQRFLGQIVHDTVPGQISETQVNATDGAVLVYVAQKSLDDESATEERAKDNIARSLRGGNTFSPGYAHWLFRSWLQQVRKEADPQPLILDFRELP